MDQPRPCVIADALELIGERWSLLVIREIAAWHNHRFADIQRATGAPRDILSARLKTLVEGGILEKVPYSEHPPRSEYHLTDAGRALRPVLMTIQEWGFNHLQDTSEAMRTPHHDHQLKPVSDFHCAECGEHLNV